MRLVREGCVPAVLYAHQQLVGKPKERFEISDSAIATTWLSRLTDAQVLAIARGESPPVTPEEMSGETTRSENTDDGIDSD